MNTHFNAIYLKTFLLTPEQKAVFELKTFHGIKTELIACYLCTSTSQVWKLLHQARLTLMR